MNNYQKILTVGLLLLLSLPVVAADLKVGYVDARRLLEESPQAEKASKMLKDEFGAREATLSDSQKELDKLQDKLQRDGDIMSESERKKLGIDILTKQRELRRKQEEFRQDITIRQNDAMGGLQDTIREAIQGIGRKEGYDIIFYEGISYANPALDLTDKVLAELRKANGPPEKK